MVGRHRGASSRGRRSSRDGARGSAGSRDRRVHRGSRGIARTRGRTRHRRARVTVRRPARVSRVRAASRMDTCAVRAPGQHCRSSVLSPQTMPRASAAAAPRARRRPPAPGTRLAFPSSSAARAFRAPPRARTPRRAQGAPAGARSAGPSGASSPAPARRPPRAPRPGNGRGFLTLVRHEGPSRSGRASHRASRAPCYGGLRWASTNPSPAPFDSLRGGRRSRPASGSDADAPQPSRLAASPGGACEATKKDDRRCVRDARKPDDDEGRAGWRRRVRRRCSAPLNSSRLRMMADATARGRAGTSLGAPFASRVRSRSCSRSSGERGFAVCGRAPG